MEVVPDRLSRNKTEGVGFFGGGLLIYGLSKKSAGILLDAEDEFNGADPTFHTISAGAVRETFW